MSGTMRYMWDWQGKINSGEEIMCKDIRREYTNVGKIEDGVKTFETETWKGFCQLIYEEFVFQDTKGKDNDGKYYINDFIWRGHRCANWDLISFFDREFQKYHKENEDIKNRLRKYILERHLNSFAYACRNKLREFGIDARDFWGWIKEDPKRIRHLWALGQHYGVATPMLDWCCSPFVAAFFAFEEESKLKGINWTNAKGNKILSLKEKENIVEKFKKCVDDTNKEKFTNDLLNKEIVKFFNQQKRVVWGLNLQITDLHERLVPQITYFDPMSSEHPRLINQRGLFTITDNGEDILTLVQKRWKEGEKERPWLIKIEIEDEKREDILRSLDSMNINHMSIYPEIYGAAKFSNLGLEFDDYARFHGQGPKVEDDPGKICNNCQENLR